jgi:Ca2+-binding RTX toxin-like protein
VALIKGTSENDFLSSEKPRDRIDGKEGNDNLIAQHGFNIVFGGEGDDRLIALSSFNILDGGVGNDYLEAQRSRNLLLGGDGDDILQSYAERNVMSGGAGNDFIFSVSGGNNVLDGGDGDDHLTALSGNNFLSGGVGDDGFYVDTQGGNLLQGDDGHDIMEAYSSGNTLYGGTGNDTVYAVGSENIVYGGSDDDVLISYSSNNVLNGESGNDMLIAAFVEDNVLSAGDGDDNVQISGTGNAADSGGGNDQLFIFNGDANILNGGDGNDLLSDSYGNNTLVGGAGSDTLTGGDGIDQADYSGSPNGVFVNLSPFFFSGTVGLSDGTIVNLSLVPSGVARDGYGGVGSTDTLSGIENIRGSAFKDFLVGTSDNNVIEGGDSDDTLLAWEGNDTLLGGLGSDFLRGDSGDDVLNGGGNLPGLPSSEDADTASYQGMTSGAVVNLQTGVASDGMGGTDTLIDIEIVRGSNFDDVIIGGNATNDTFERYEALAGDDIMDGGSGFDEVSYQLSTGSVVVDLASGTASDGLGGADLFTNMEYIRGSNHADTLLGDDSDNRFRGLAGADLMDGRGGIDEADYSLSPNGVIANLGSDSYTGNVGFGDVTVPSGTARDGHGGSGSTDLLISIENLRGSETNDILVGSTDDNGLRGEGGDDVLIGGAGSDTFEWEFANQGTTLSPAIDTVVDFNSTEDKLDLKDLLQGETASSLEDYLHFTYDGTSTTIEVKSHGTPDQVDQEIVLLNVELTSLGSDTDIISNLISNGKLITDIF